VTTRAPEASANSRVASVLPPSTTTISATPRIVASVSGKNDEAFSVGMITDRFAARSAGKGV
jgi:hypothetical protein